MNYIKRLQQEVATHEAQITATAEGIALLRSYLMSSKFHSDTTVQVSDVLLRLAELESHAQACADTREATWADEQAQRNAEAC